MMEEQVAIAQLQQGDISGLEALVRIHQVRAIRTAFLVTHDRALAEDVVQAAFLRAYERIGQFDAQRPFGPWFFRSVARDAVKAAVRGERQVSLARTSQTADCVTDSGAEPGISWEKAETRQEVWAALGTLSPAQRSAIVQRYYLGLSEAEMASVSNCPPGTIKSRLHGARERLRLLLRPTICE